MNTAKILTAFRALTEAEKAKFFAEVAAEPTFPQIVRKTAAKARFTSLELKAIEALQVESSGNGHDFGLMELVVWEGSRMQLGALVTTLKQKGVITSMDTTEVNGGPKRGGERYNQYVLAEEFRV